MREKVSAKVDAKKETKRILFGLIGAVIMAVNIKTFVRAGGLYPGGFTVSRCYFRPFAIDFSILQYRFLLSA